MKTKDALCFTLTVFLNLALFTNTNAQSGHITVQHEGSPTFHKTIAAAIEAATDNDTVYLPGTTFNETVTLNKRLYIVGTGYHPDSTQVSGMTRIFGGINILTGGSGSKLEGFYLDQDVNFNYNQDINNITMLRCRIRSLNANQASTNGNSQLTVSECLVQGNISGHPDMTNVLIENSIITGLIRSLYNQARVEHCILLYKSSSSSTGYNFLNCEGTAIYSNVIMSVDLTLPNTCIFKNNLFAINATLSYPNENNIVGQTLSNIFMGVPDGMEYTFSYDYDYHLKPGTPEEPRIGTDGTPMGIYGGTNPFKAGAVPSTPHIYSIEVANENDENGMLNVKIGVAAQER